jgi:hypothetical protein
MTSPWQSEVHQTFARRSTMSGNLFTKVISRAACAFGRARPCSQFSSVRGFVRRKVANNPRERRNRVRNDRTKPCGSDAAEVPSAYLMPTVPDASTITSASSRSYNVPAADGPGSARHYE